MRGRLVVWGLLGLVASGCAAMHMNRELEQVEYDGKAPQGPRGFRKYWSDYGSLMSEEVKGLAEPPPATGVNDLLK